MRYRSTMRSRAVLLGTGGEAVSDHVVCRGAPLVIWLDAAG
jgi:hypothetical protein